MKAVIAAAGYGTRMLPVTKSIPKELLPVGSKPVIQYIVEWIVGADIKDILIITSAWKQAIEDYFDKNYELEEILRRKWKTELLDEINKPKYLANYSFVKQKKQLWFAHAVLETKPWINDDYFLLSVWDEIFQPEVYKEILDIHKRTWWAVIWLQEVVEEDIHKYGIVDIKWDKVVGMVEKPSLYEAPSNLRIIGIYILPKKVFSIIENLEIDEKTGEILLTDALDIIIKEDWLYPYITKYKTWDIGTPEKWLKANVEIADLNYNL